MAPITSVELNYIIFRYLQESGFTHTAFTFDFESGVDKSPIDGTLVPPAALVRLMQKGLQYVEMEANLSNVNDDVDEDFCFLQPMDIITKDIYELQKIMADKKKSHQLGGSKENERACSDVKIIMQERMGRNEMWTEKVNRVVEGVLEGYERSTKIRTEIGGMSILGDTE